MDIKEVSNCDEKSSSGSGAANHKIKQNLELADELHKPIIRNL